MATPPPPPRKVVLAHAPANQMTHEEVWRARRVLLAILSWQGTVGLCPLPPDLSPPAPTRPRTPAMTALSLLGVERAHGVRGLDLTMADLDHRIILAAVRDLRVAGDLEDLRHLLAARGGLRLLDQHLNALLKRVRECWAQVAKEDALLIASEHSWILLALAERLCTQADDREILRRLPLHDFFPGLCTVHASGHWGGFIDLSRDQKIGWYLERA